MGWPPKAGELLPRAEEAIGVREKLAGYSLNKDTQEGAAKAKGFEEILGVTLDSIDYLEREIRLGINRNSITSTRENWPFGLNCVVDFPLRGLGPRRSRIIPIRTVWIIERPEARPRLTSAYLKP